MSVSFDFITPRLVTGGGVHTSDDVDALKAAGVTAVLSLRDDVDHTPLFAGSGIAFRWNPTDDPFTLIPPHKPPEWFAASLLWALPFLCQPHQRVACLCHDGINRGPSTAYCLMLALGWGHLAARVQILFHRPQALARYADDAEAAVKALGYA